MRRKVSTNKRFFFTSTRNFFQPSSVNLPPQPTTTTTTTPTPTPTPTQLPFHQNIPTINWPFLKVNKPPECYLLKAKHYFHLNFEGRLGCDGLRVPFLALVQSSHPASPLLAKIFGFLVLLYLCNNNFIEMLK